MLDKNPSCPIEHLPLEGNSRPGRRAIQWNDRKRRSGGNDVEKI